MKFFLSLALCKYSILSNKPTLSVWFCAEQSSLSATHFLLQWIFVNIEFIYFFKFMQDLHIPAIHAILSELHSALSTKSALSLIYGWSLISKRWFSDFLIKNVSFSTFLDFCVFVKSRFQNLRRHHKHCYLMEVTFMLISFKS